MADDTRLDGKVAIITGAAGEIGAATMQLFAARGARIFAVDRDEAQLQRAVAALPSEARGVAITADVTREDDVAGYVQRAVADAGRIDVFYNNAGIEGVVAPIQKFALDDFRRVLDVNVVGVFLGLKHVLPVMLQQGAGSIINTASIAGLVGAPGIAVYSASKHAVIGLTKSVAVECSDTGVRVNCVCPGLIHRDGIETAWPSGVERWNEAAALKRLGRPEDIADACLFLASDAARWITGVDLVVDGGVMARPTW